MTKIIHKTPKISVRKIRRSAIDRRYYFSKSV